MKDKIHCEKPIGKKNTNEGESQMIAFGLRQNAPPPVLSTATM
jgi:hypothetical protein